jgi:hypothetical protein
MLSNNAANRIWTENAALKAILIEQNPFYERF